MDGNPHPCDLLYVVLTEGAEEIEKLVHELLTDTKEGKEWFYCAADIAISLVVETCEEIFHAKFYAVQEEGTAAIKLEAVNENWI